MSVKIVILGSINRDATMKVPRFPKLGEMIEAYELDFNIGGKGSNQAVQAALLNADVHFIGGVGDDENGRVAKAGIASKGVNVEHLHIIENTNTGNAYMIVDPNGDNLLTYYPGANRKLTKEVVDRSAELIRSADILMTQTEINPDVIEYGLKIAKDAGIPTLLNPAPPIPLPDSIFALLDYITPNETETEVYTGLLRSEMDFEDWKKQSAEWFLQKGVKGACITLGEKGSYYYDGREGVTVPPFKVSPVDTTAAGDAFNAGLAVGISEGLPVAEAMRMGCACGGLATESLGAQSSICERSKVETLMNGR